MNGLSFRQIEDTLRAAFKVIEPPQTNNGPWWWLADVFPDAAIVEWTDGKIYEVPYTVEGANTVIAQSAEWKQVVRGWISKEAGGEINGYIAKGADAEPLVLIPSGGFQDVDGETVSGPDYLAKAADAINEGRVKMTIDVWHLGHPSRYNPSPKAEKIVIGHIEKAAFENDHLALLPVFNTPEDEAAVRENAGDLGLSMWFNGAAKDAEGVFRGEPKGDLSVAIMPRGYEAYQYTSIS